MLANSKEMNSPNAGQLELTDVVELVLATAKKMGASSAEVIASVDEGLSTGVRLGNVETLEHTRDKCLAITVYLGQSKGNASTADTSPAAIEESVRMACNIAKYTQDDEFSGLADAPRMAKNFRDLDIYHPWQLTPERAIELALKCEHAARSHEGINNSEGANVSTHQSKKVYANSHGFIGERQSSIHSISCSTIAGSDDSMERDYWYTTARCRDDLEAPEAVGNQAAIRTLRRLNSRSIKTCKSPILFSPEVAIGLLGHFAGAISGGAIYRGTSFLAKDMGKQIFPESISIFQKPHMKRGLASANFDSEGVATENRNFIVDGKLTSFLLSSYSARKLGLESTGNAGGVQNLEISMGNNNAAEMLKQMGSGLLVTELMGQGVHIISGDYSRGASGFWVEDGEIAFPVSEVTIAGNLREMFHNIVSVGADIDTRSSIRTGSILIEEMMIAGN